MDNDKIIGLEFDVSHLKRDQRDLAEKIEQVSQDCTDRHDTLVQSFSVLEDQLNKLIKALGAIKWASIGGLTILSLANYEDLGAVAGKVLKLLA